MTPIPVRFRHSVVHLHSPVTSSEHSDPSTGGPGSRYRRVFTSLHEHVELDYFITFADDGVPPQAVESHLYRSLRAGGSPILS
jgi:hypothetical protein